MLELKFREKILRSNTNNSLVIPNLSYRNLILSGIELDSQIWDFEVSLRASNFELLKLNTTYFQHHQIIDLEPYRWKLNEGEQLEFQVKPKHAPKDFDLNITYRYVEGEGALSFQQTVKLTELEDSSCSLLKDLSHNCRPTRLMIKTTNSSLIENIKFIPLFKMSGDGSTGEVVEWEQKFDKPCDSVDLDFRKCPVTVMEMLEFYRLEFQLKFESKSRDNLDTPIHFLGYGFKKSK